jgi:ribA/ribD-fused uncharacterized protein
MDTREAVLSNYRSRIGNMDGVYGLFDVHRALSNFHMEPFTWSGIVWPASENAYMAAKSDPCKPDASFAHMEPKVAKSAGQKVPLCATWDKDKFLIMQEILCAKFRQCPIARSVLVSTKDMYIEETNWWNDTTWGVCGGQGHNRLGKILMDLRKIAG